MKPEALIILTPGFPANETDTTCIPPQQVFVKALTEVAPRLKIIVLTFQYPFFSMRYEWNGVEVISFGSKIHSRVVRKFVPVRVLLELIKFNKQYRIIGLLSFWFGRCARVG